MAKHKMKKRTKIFFGVIIAVGVSVAALKYFFHGGPEVHAERFVNHIESEYNLDAQQSDALRQLTGAMLDIGRNVKSGRDEHLREVMDIVFEPTLDQQRANLLVQEKTELFEARANEMIALLGNFTDQLTPSQKQQMRNRLENKMDKWRRWHN